MARPRYLLRYVKLPDRLENGNYDRFGNKVDDPRDTAVVLHALPGGPWQCWGVFDRELERGEYGALSFSNVPGDAVPGGAFTEWDRARAEPEFDERRLLVLYSVQRSLDGARIIGRNESDRRVAAAAAVLFVPPPSGGGGGGGGGGGRGSGRRSSRKRSKSEEPAEESASASESS